jgi:hypothetical protein
VLGDAHRHAGIFVDVFGLHDERDIRILRKSGELRIWMRWILNKNNCKNMKDKIIKFSWAKGEMDEAEVKRIEARNKKYANGWFPEHGDTCPKA